MLRARLGYTRDPDGKVLTRGRIVLKGFKDHEDKFPNPPVKLSDLEAAIENFDASRTLAGDGGRKAFAQKKKCRGILIRILIQLGHVFLLSGFELAGKSGSSDEIVPRILQIKQGKSGEFFVSFLAFYRKVIYYELRYGPQGPDGVLPDPWMPPLQSRQARRPILVQNLIPGTIYCFQVRVYKNNETFSDWSQTAIKMVI
jgi:hypothetical protein